MERLKKILVFFMFSCKKASELVNKNEVLGLTIAEKITLLYHNTICRTCTHYKKHSAIIETVFTTSFSAEKNDSQLPEEVKLKIVSELKKLV